MTPPPAPGGVSRPTNDRMVRQVTFEAAMVGQALRGLVDWAEAGGGHLILSVAIHHSERDHWCWVEATILERADS